MTSRFAYAIALTLVSASVGCSAASSSDPAAGYPTSESNPGADAGGGFGSVGTGGAQDFALFRKALEEGRVPAVDSLDAAGFFAEHYTSLPAPACGLTFCLQGQLAVSRDLARGGTWTLLQMGMNSPIDPATVKKPPLELAVVLDHSGSMAGANKMEYAKLGVQHLVDALGPEDRFTLIQFDDKVETIYGPSIVTDKAALKARIAEISLGGGTNLYDSLEAGYKAIETATELQQRRVIFLTDGVATAGNTSSDAIKAMSAKYNQKHLGLTTIGLGTDVSVGLLRGLAEQGSGNFYYIERVEAVQEVFKEELAFFVAPIAYDLELTYTQLPAYSTREVFGSNLWTTVAGGGKINIPSVFLVSRTSSEPSPTGGRRGGGSAIIADLTAASKQAFGMHDVAKLSLKYRKPGSTTFETQELTVRHEGEPGVAPEGGSFTSKSVEKNALILSFFVAFRDATKLAQSNRANALALLENFKAVVTPQLAGWTDEDLADDLKILQRYIDVLN